MAERGWTRRLDDRADGFFRHRFGFGLIDGPEPNIRQELRRTFLVAGVIINVLIVALVLSDQSERVPAMLGVVLAAVFGTLAGREIRQRHKGR